MPLKGHQMAKKIFEAINNGYQNVKIIAQSSNESEKITKKCLKAGIEQVFKKPLKYKMIEA